MNSCQGKGVPDISTRQLVHLMSEKFAQDLRFFCLTDANPYGIQIMSIYKYGSKELNYDKLNLNVPALEWIGLKITDLDHFHLASSSHSFKMKLNKNDEQTARCLIKKLNALFEFELVGQVTIYFSRNKNPDFSFNF